MNKIDKTVETFNFSVPIHIRWNDLDALGHVNNIYYFEYFQIGRSHYMPKVSTNWDWNKHMFVLAHIACDYIKEITLNCIQPTVHVRTASLSNKSFEMHYLITSTSTDGAIVIHAVGKSINVMVDIVEKKTTVIPEWLRKSLIDFERLHDKDN